LRDVLVREEEAIHMSVVFRDVLVGEGEAICMSVVWRKSVERCVGKRRGTVVI